MRKYLNNFLIKRQSKPIKASPPFNSIPRTIGAAPIILFLLTFFLFAFYSFAQQEAKKARVLVVTGCDYPGHEWKKTAPALTNILAKDPRLQVEVLYDANKLGEVDLKQFDAVILHFMNWETTSPPASARNNLQQFVKSGKGLMLIHFACGAWQDWDEFKNIAGRIWDPKTRQHDPRGEFLVEIVDKEHPITRGLKDFQTYDELYTCLKGDAPIKVLAKARSKVDNKDYPMAFVLQYGEGRVFHTVLGHDVRALTNTLVPDLLRRGCDWVCGLNPDM
ncbi:MAG TPA: ThuA domain-containing protein [Verrucomicrobiota bacterium]|nr:ThuA domain-containing protein [Verrucomicrobiota bacterium]